MQQTGEPHAKGVEGKTILRCPCWSLIVCKSLMDNLSLIGTAQAANHLGVSMSWLRSKKSTCEFIAGEHWIYATGSPGGRVLWNVNAICQWQVEQTKLYAKNSRILRVKLRFTRLPLLRRLYEPFQLQQFQWRSCSISPNTDAG